MSNRARALNDLVDCLSGNVHAPRDWRALVALSSETLTIGSLADALLSVPAVLEMPQNIRDLLVDVRERARQRNARLKGQFFELLAALNAIGIEPIVMRGMARLLAGPGEESRLLSDIDLLVPLGRLEDCTRALLELGYGHFRTSDEKDVPSVFCRSRDVGMVDVHTQLQPSYLKLGYDRLASDCLSVDLGTGRILMPSPTCQLLFTIVHDQLHDGDYWRGLVDMRHLVDIHRIAAQGVNWTDLDGFFPPGSPKNALHVQLRTARALMKIEVPDEYCGGAWSAAQELRRRVQVHAALLRPLFTLLTLVVDPPPRSNSTPGGSTTRTETAKEAARRRLDHYFRGANPGKLLLK
ncbi:MAG TPA: nucleotidyltransferase family protein [Sphingomicrobium sp.]|nr:nucleotidyltransferase family protein [Sphingomicrobium sp.]